MLRVLLIFIALATACGGSNVAPPDASRADAHEGNMDSATSSTDVRRSADQGLTSTDSSEARDVHVAADVSVIATMSRSIGAAGGMIELNAVTLIIPPGALTADTAIGIAEIGATLPEPYRAVTPIYRFTPDGLAFLVPATVRFAIVGDTMNVDVLWSRVPPATGFDNLGKTRGPSQISAQITHFSDGFGGDTGGTCANDSVCRQAAGGPTPGNWYCCGTGDIKNCVDTNAHAQNCDGCGRVCEVGKYCAPISQSTATCLTCEGTGAACALDRQCCSGTCTPGAIRSSCE